MSVVIRLGLRQLGLLGILALACVLGAFIVAWTKDARGATTPACKQITEVTMGTAVSASYAPPQIASSLGLMKKNCVRLTPVPIASPAISLAQTVSGRQDLALINPTGIISAVAQGQKLKIIAPNTTEQQSAPGTGNAMYIKNNGPIKTWKDFEGKRVGTGLIGSTNDIAMRILLYRHHVDINKVEFVFVTTGQPMIDALVTERNAAGQVSAPFDYRGRKAGLIKAWVVSPQEEVWGKHVPSSYIIARADWVDSHKDLVDGIQKAYLEAALRVQRNPQIFADTVRLILKLTPQEANGMYRTYMATEYNIEAVLKQQRDALRFKAIPEGISEAQLRALYDPLPPLSSLPKLKALPTKK